MRALLCFNLNNKLKTNYLWDKLDRKVPLKVGNIHKLVDLQIHHRGIVRFLLLSKINNNLNFLLTLIINKLIRDFIIKKEEIEDEEKLILPDKLDPSQFNRLDTD